MPGFSFTKAERLSSQKIIAELMRHGHSIRAGSLKLIFLNTELPVSFPVQVCIAVPKKRIAKAHQRNTLKRRMREAYRLQKHELYTFLRERNQQLALMVMYQGIPAGSYQSIYNDLQLALDKFMKNYEDHS